MGMAYRYLSRVLCGMIECSQNTCHMAKTMVQLPYGNEREKNDGGRVAPTPERAWMEPVQAQATTARLSLRSEVEEGRNLHHLINQVANAYTGGSAKENQHFITGRKRHVLSLHTERPTNQSYSLCGNQLQCRTTLPCTLYFRPVQCLKAVMDTGAKGQSTHSHSGGHRNRTNFRGCKGTRIELDTILPRTRYATFQYQWSIQALDWWYIYEEENQASTEARANFISTGRRGGISIRYPCRCGDKKTRKLRDARIPCRSSMASRCSRIGGIRQDASIASKQVQARTINPALSVTATRFTVVVSEATTAYLAGCCYLLLFCHMATKCASGWHEGIREEGQALYVVIRKNKPR